jgi:hypothetical protein
MASSSFYSAESVVAVGLIVGYLIWLLVRRLSATRPGWGIGRPIAAAFALRLIAMAAVGAAGLNGTLRGGDEITFLTSARTLAATPFGHGYWPHGAYQLQTVVFALEIKLFHLASGGMRLIQVGIALAGMILILASVYDLAGGRAARLAGWVLALEPGSIFFNSALHKEPLMELAAGLVVFGCTMLWRRLDVRGILICALGGLIAVETRSYAGWFLVSGAVLVLLHAALRNLDRPLRAMPVVYAVIVAGFVATPVILQASSKKNLQVLQVSQQANATGAGETTAGSAGGANGDNLALEQVDFSSRGAIVKNLPKRIRDLVLEPYPWRLGDTSQRFGAIGTLVAYVVLFLLLRYAWLSRGRVFRRAAPLVYPMLFLLVAYSLSVGNAGTGFRYRTHLVTLAVGAMVILRQRVLEQRRARPVAEPDEAQPRSAAVHVPSPA